MRILFIGSLQPGQTSRMRMEALQALGHDIAPIDSFDRWGAVSSLERRMQQRLCAGPIVSSLNQEVLRIARDFRADLVWAEKQEYLRPSTFRALRNTGARLLHYTPDPYFTLAWKRTRLMDRSLPLFDYLVTSKRYELAEYEQYPGTTIYMPLGFGGAEHRPMVPSSSSACREYASDVSFLGGWEPRREGMLDAVARIADLTLSIRGYGWDHLADGRMTPRRYFATRRNAADQPYRIRRNPQLAACVRSGEVYGDEYAWAISAARISLGFLRMICPDQHTTRTFEIPACGSMLLADRTGEHQEFFEEGVEAEYFSNTNELVDKLRYYLANENARVAVARRGYERCLRSGYSYLDRISGVMAQIER